tara:strand:- start:3890 stop:4690 length:801 start_codon:yes stop_codon:yes gene_type:complete
VSLTMTRGWSTASWEDPDGGTILLHGTFPTVVLPRSLWPNPKAWDGLALLDDAGAPEAWLQEEEDERASPGVNLEAARFGIGHEAHLLDALTSIDGPLTGRFPDPEPLRLFREAQRSDRSVYFLEPNLDDEAWSDHLSLEAKERTDWRRLIRRVRSRRAWRKALSDAASGVTSGPEDGMAEVMVSTRAWWQMWDADLTVTTRLSRDRRFAARARGALAEVRKAGGSTLLLVLVEPRVDALVKALNEGPPAEVIVSYDDLVASFEEA